MIPLLCFILLVLSTAIAENCSYTYDNTQYSRSLILTIKGLPTNLVVNPKNKDLLFTLIDLESLQNDHEQTKMDQYILRNGEPIIIDNINGQAAAVDVKNNKVYVASDDGLNILNDSDIADYISFKNEDIVQLFKPKHTDDLYAVTFPDNTVFIIDTESNEKKKIEDVPCAYIIAVDSGDNIFYECDSKYIKVLLKDFHEPIEYVGIAKNTARAIAVDENNRVILAANDGLYHLKTNSLIPKKLMNLEFMPSGIALDGTDIYLSTNGVIYKYSSNSCYDKDITELNVVQD